MYALFLFILFPLLYSYNRTWYFIYTLLFFVLGIFIAYKAGLSNAHIIHNVFYIGVLIPYITGRSFRKYDKQIIIWILVYVAYLLFLSIIHINDFVQDIKGNFRMLFVFIFAVEVYENIRMNRINLDYFVKAYKVIVVAEIILCWIQFFSHDFGNLFRITEYKMNGELTSISGSSEDILSNNLCYGTLMRASAIANFLTTSIVVLLLAKHKAGMKLNDYIFIAISVLTLLITGIRAPFLVLLLMFYFMFLRGRKNIYGKIADIVVVIVIFAFLLPFLSSIGAKGGLNSLDNTILRSLNVFTQFETGSISEEGTLTWPLSMIPYIVQHPLLGNGLHYGSGYFMSLNFHVLEDVSISDAGFFFYWAEYGLIGLLIFFFFYYYIVKIAPCYNIDKSAMRLLVIMLFLLSIVDCSIINLNCTTVFTLAPILIYYYSQSKDIKNTIK